MIIGKILMVLNSCDNESIDYLISKRTLELRTSIKKYSLDSFIEEIGVSKTSMIRYLKKIGIDRFTRYKEVIYEESIKTYVDMKYLKENITHQKISKDSFILYKKIEGKKRIFILGDGNRFSLILYQKALIYLGVFIEIPVYIGSEEDIMSCYNIGNDDLVIIVSLHEPYDTFLSNRTLFYREGRYLNFMSNCDVGFIGMPSHYLHEDLSFALYIKEDYFDQKLIEFIKLFHDLSLVKMKESDIDDYI
ncbi:MAG: hypothetical protein RR630_02410 [Coprobacillus sp.]